MSTREYTRFPLYFDISSWKILVIGGGSIACRRINTLLTFGPEVTVCAPSLQESVQERVDAIVDPDQNSGRMEDMSEVTSADKGSDPSAVMSSASSGKLFWIQDRFELSMLEEASWNMVLACTSDHELNSRVYHKCRELGILANNASNQEECDFFFPAIVTGDGVVIGISSDGSDHGKVRRTAAKIRSEYGE